MTLRMTQAEVDAYQAKRLAEKSSQRHTHKRDLFPLELPLRLYSSANDRVHPLKRYRQHKAHRNAIRNAVHPALLPKLPAIVTITRIGPRKLDTDNLAISAKAVRDALAELWGVDDGSDLYDWRYAQESAGWGVYRVRIEVAPR